VFVAGPCPPCNCFGNPCGCLERFATAGKLYRATIIGLDVCTACCNGEINCKGEDAAHSGSAQCTLVGVYGSEPIPVEVPPSDCGIGSSYSVVQYSVGCTFKTPLQFGFLPNGNSFQLTQVDDLLTTRIDVESWFLNTIDPSKPWYNVDPATTVRMVSGDCDPFELVVEYQVVKRQGPNIGDDDNPVICDGWVRVVFTE